MKEFRQHNSRPYQKYRYTFFYYYNNYEVFTDYEGSFCKEELTQDRIAGRNNDSNPILVTK